MQIPFPPNLETVSLTGGGDVIYDPCSNESMYFTLSE